jgi:hypothetical protein
VDHALQELLRGNGKFHLSMALIEHDKTLFSQHVGGDLDVKWVVGSPVTLGDNKSFRLKARPLSNLIASTTNHLPQATTSFGWKSTGARQSKKVCNKTRLGSL